MRCPTLPDPPVLDTPRDTARQPAHEPSRRPLLSPSTLLAGGCLLLCLIPAPLGLAEEGGAPAADAELAASQGSPEEAIDEDGEETSATFSEEVTVTGTREERPLSEVPGAVDVVPREAIDNSRGEALDSVLATTPGVSAQSNNGASDVKLSIRGFGARSTFGVRDVLVLIDGVPITDADGFTRLDQIDLAAAERVEVVKGPASALYGNAAFGGVINVITRRGSMTDRSLRLRGEGGELGFFKALISIGGGSVANRLTYAVHASRSELTGFREHNDNEVRRVNGTLDVYLSDRTTVRTLLNMSRLRDELPGSLDREQFETDPDQVRPFFTLFDWRRDDDRSRLGALVEHVAGRRSTFEGRLFVLTRDLDHPIFQVIDQQGLRFMGGVRWARDLEGFDTHHRLTVGLDGDREDIDHERFVNVLGERGARTLLTDETVETVGLYVQDEMALRDDLSLTLGARWDEVRFVEEDLLEDDVDLSDERTFERLSPKLGVLWQAQGNLAVHVNLATAFQVPTKNELSATVGETGFNQDLDPQEARHAEVGVRGTVRRLRWEVSVFQTDVDDEILPRTRVQDTTLFGNVGETRHRGFEGSLDVRLPGQLDLEAGYAWSDNQFTDFTEVGGEVLDGNTLPGHPEHKGTLQLSTRRARGLNGSVTFERIGTVFLNDANTETHRPYSLLHAGVSWEMERFSVFVRGTNLTDELHAAWIAVNDPDGNFFLPAPGRAVTAGFDVRF